MGGSRHACHMMMLRLHVLGLGLLALATEDDRIVAQVARSFLELIGA